MSDKHDEAMRLANEMAEQFRKVANGLPLTTEQLNIAEEMSIDLANMARQLRFDIEEKHGVDLPSLMDAAALAFAFIHVDYRERMHAANPVPPPPDQE